MAKDDRVIKSGVVLGGVRTESGSTPVKTYTAGMEDELAEAADAKQLKYLAEQGAIEGTWGKGAKAEESSKSTSKGK